MSNAVDRLSKQNHWNNNTDDWTSDEGKSLIECSREERRKQKLKAPRRNPFKKKVSFHASGQSTRERKPIMEDERDSDTEVSKGWNKNFVEELPSARNTDSLSP